MALTITELAQTIVDDNPPTTRQFAVEMFDGESGKWLKYCNLITHPKYQEVWMRSSANEFGRLAQGVRGQIKGTNTIFFVQKRQVPQDRGKDVTCTKFVCELRPNEAEVHRTRLNGEW